MMGAGVIEELRHGSADLVEPRPVEVTKDDALFSFRAGRVDQVHLRAEILPSLAVVNQVINPRPKFGVERGPKFLLPPEKKRKIGIEVRKNNAREQLGAGAAQP